MSESEETSWPRYTGSLKSPLVLDGDVVHQIEAKLARLCELYGIELADPLWEKILLSTLLYRHVPGFATKRQKAKTVDGTFLIEIIDGLKDHYERETGMRPSTDAAVTEVIEVASKDEKSPFHGMSHGRAMRIYSGRAEEMADLQQDLMLVSERLTESFRGQSALASDPHSCAALILEAIRRRHR